MERMDQDQGASMRSAIAGGDAIGLLTADHERVSEMFDRFDEADEGDRMAIARQICQELKIHAQIEEEIFYPAAREAIDEEELVDEAVEEHAEAKELIAQIEASGSRGSDVEELVQQLREAIEHHVEEEESELFPDVRSAGVDLLGIGTQLSERKQQLMSSGL